MCSDNDIKIPMTAFNIQYKASEIEYDFSKTFMEMIIDASGSRDQWLRDHGINPEDFPDNFDLGMNALSHPKFSISHNSEISNIPLIDQEDYVCPYFKEVNLEITYSNKMVFPKEITSNKCLYEAHLIHQQKFYIGHSVALNKHGKNLKKIIPVITKELQDIEPVKKTVISSTSTKIKNELDEIIQVLYADMKKEADKYTKRNSSSEEFARMEKRIRECLESS